MSHKSTAQRARERPCRTFFGSHGCSKQAGHQGDHVCDCKLRYCQEHDVMWLSRGGHEHVAEPVSAGQRHEKGQERAD